jgi:phage terminase large subunit-like protein
MKLHPYQLDLVEQWHAGDTRAHLTVIGAGNAKTTTLGAYLTAALFLTEESSIPIVADTVTQAVLTTWGRIKRFVELNPELEGRAQVLEGQGTRRGVYVPGMGGHAFPIADKPSGLQGLIPSIAVLEETSEASMNTLGALMNRLGKRAGGKLIGISTPSFTPDNALITVQQRAQSGDPLPGVTLNEWISPQTDHRDESDWHLANPALDAGVLDIGAIRTDLALLPEQQFRAYRLCQNPKGGESCWINSLDESGQETGDAYEVWKRGASAYTLPDGRPTWVGVDVAKSRDHAAAVWGQFRDDGRLHTVARIWTPTDEADIPLDEIADHLRMLCSRFDVKGIWYDPSYFYNAPQLEREGLPMVSVPPSEQRMSPLVGHAYQSIRRTRITHNDQEQYTQHVLAARRKYGPRGFTLEKRQLANKIDAAVALVLCHAAAFGIGVEPEPDYDEERAWRVY